MQDLLHEVQNSLEELRVAEITDFFGSECLAMRSRSRLVSIPRTVILYPIVFPDRIEIIAGKNGQLHRRTVSIEGIDVLEELRVLQFAQPLGAAGGVSLKRVNQGLVALGA